MIKLTHRASYLVSLREPNIYHDSGDFTRIGDFTWEYVWRVLFLYVIENQNPY